MAGLSLGEEQNSETHSSAVIPTPNPAAGDQPAVGQSDRVSDSNSNRFLRRIILALLVVVFATNVHRAVTHSITSDEALTFTSWVDGPWSQIIHRYIANNHVLHTVLAKLATDNLGIHTWTLRLPSLCGGALFLFVLFRMTQRWKSQLYALATIALVALNPFILDYQSAARGYGLAIAFLLAGFALSTSLVRGSKKTRRLWLGIAFCFGLSVGFNFSFVFPVMALATSTVFLHGRPTSTNRRTVVRQFIVWCVIPTIALVASVAIPVQRVAKFGHFNFGAESLSEMTRSLIDASFLHHESAIFVQPHLEKTASWIIPLILAGLMVIAAIQIYLNRAFSRSQERAVFQLSTLSLAVCTLGLLLAHTTMGLPYPKTRTGLYLALFTCLSFGSFVAQSAGWKTAAGLVLLPFVLIPIVVFAAQFPGQHYADWTFDASSELIFEWLEDDAARLQNGSKPVRILSVPFHHEPSLNFYRRSRNAKWMKPVERATLHGEPRPGIYGATYDYLVQMPGWENIPSTKRRYKVVFRDPKTGTVISIPRE